MEYILAPSILAADFKNLGCEMKKTEENGAEYLHFDVMDGMFVPSISFGMPVLASICGATEQVMDVHLMIKEPIRYIEDFKKAGADHDTSGGLRGRTCDNRKNPGVRDEGRAFYLSGNGYRRVGAVFKRD